MKNLRCIAILPPSLVLSVCTLGAELQEVEVKGRLDNLVGSATSASVGVISGDELALRPLLRTGDVLEVVPGLVATQHSGSGKANQYFLRGFNLDHGTDFATSVDGMPVNMRSHGHGQGYTDLNFLIPELIREISFKKGSYYADVGDFSGAGSAAISTVREVNGRDIALGYGKYGYDRLLLTGSLDNSGGRFIYGLETQGYDGPWSDIDENIDKKNLWLKQSWGNADDYLDLTFMGYDNAWNSADQVPGRAIESGLIGRFGSIDPTVGGKSSRYSLSANWQKQAGARTWSASAFAIDYKMDLWSNFSYMTGPDGDQFKQVDDRAIYGGQAAVDMDSRLAGMTMENTLGVQYRYDDIAEVGLLSTRQRAFLGDIRLDKVQQWSTSVYWQNELYWSPRLRSVVGLRYDYYDFDVTGLAAAQPATLSPNSGTENDDLVTGAASLIYALSDNYEVYASIGNGFHSNDARGTTTRLDPVSGDPVSPVDPLVDTLGYEIGMRAFITDRLNASAAIWGMDIDSELLFVGDAGNTEDTGVGSKRRGVELTGYYLINDRWSFDFEYAWTDAAFEHPVDGSDEIPGALDKVFSGGLSMRLDNGLSAYLRLRHFSDFPLDGGERADGSTLASLRLGYRYSDHLSLNLDILNMLDSDDHDIEYFYESRLPGEAAPVEDHHFHVFEPRAFRAYLTYTF